MTLLGLVALASLASATPINEVLNHQSRAESSIKWGPCPPDEFNTTAPVGIECATLEVPLDYSDPKSTATLGLSLLRSRAPGKGGPKGSILVNFGGPGYGGRTSLANRAAMLHERSGGQHDLVTWDPRGTAQTMPFSCFNTSEERPLAALKYPVSPSIDEYPHALAAGWANMKAWNSACALKNKDNVNGTLIGTAFSVRDAMKIVDALGEDGKLRLWGISYGTALGMTAASMFPERMDRLVLDGVVNIHNYYGKYSIDADQLLSADEGWEHFLQACIDAGIEKCAIADLAATGKELAALLEDTVDEYTKSPVATGPLVVTGFNIKLLFFAISKIPDPEAVFPASVAMRQYVEKTNLTEALEITTKLVSGTETPDDALAGIKCSDTIPRAKSAEDLRAEMDYTLRSSKYFGSAFKNIPLTCSTFSWHAKEVYKGEFGHTKMKTPILFIGNSYDVSTSMHSVHAMEDLFEGSVAVEQHGFGHASLAQESKCTIQAIQEYFLEAKLPKKGTVCEVETPLF